MAFLNHSSLRCPLDECELTYADHTLVCDHGHQFDVGKPGYANLLSVQHKQSRDPGDSKAMIVARSQFLSRGFYQPVAQLLIDQIATFAPSKLTIVDAGCGEGYYLHALSNAFDKQLHLIGFDISKWAVQQAAKRCDGTWLIASNKRIPIGDGSADVILDMFGFPDFDSFSRVLKPNGVLICVTPAQNHLIELRELLYDEIRNKTDNRNYPPRWNVIHSQRLKFEVVLNQEDVQNLLLMTPHLFRAQRDRLRQIADLQELTVSVDIAVDTLQLHDEV